MPVGQRLAFRLRRSGLDSVITGLNSRFTPRAMQPPQIRPVSESDVEAVLLEAGGSRAHPDADRRAAMGADFRLDDAIIELKLLEEDGLDKPDRRARLADLFRSHWPDRPVIVLDPAALPDAELRTYKSILQGPIKNGIAHAKKQLSQSRREYPDATCSVLMIVNNSYGALTHEELLAIAGERARQDTSQVDVVVVAGCYLHSDGFDSYAIWPIDQVVLHAERPFSAYARLSDAWGQLAEWAMADLMQGRGGSKGPLTDSVFTLDGVTYVKPAPAIGAPSQFWVHGRPRQDGLQLASCPPVAITFPDVTAGEWKRLRLGLEDPGGRFVSLEAWRAHGRAAAATATDLQPFVPMKSTAAGFETWRRKTGNEPSVEGLKLYANELFDTEARRLLASARKLEAGAHLPLRSVVVVTEVIGQDIANDVSHLALMEARPGAEPRGRTLGRNLRIRHQHALALGAAYAIAFGVGAVLWREDLRYAWH